MINKTVCRTCKILDFTEFCALEFNIKQFNMSRMDGAVVMVEDPIPQPKHQPKHQ